jgi:hypothetical protein
MSNAQPGIYTSVSIVKTYIIFGLVDIFDVCLRVLDCDCVISCAIFSKTVSKRALVPY